MNYSNLPDTLKDIPQWCNYVLVPKPDGKMGKIPINPHTLWDGSSKNPKRWSDFDKAAVQIGKTAHYHPDKKQPNLVAEGEISGVGFVFTPKTGITGIDFDHCIDPDTGNFDPWVLEWVQRFDSYTEISQSGTGIHILVRGSLPQNKGVHAQRVEMYNSGRYFALTGNTEAPRPIRPAQEVIDALYAETKKTPEREPTGEIRSESPLPNAAAIIEKARRAKNGALFETLFSGDTCGYADDRSRADAALCDILAFWTKDPELIDAVFRQSGLMRDKWDEMHGSQTYGAMTIADAMERVQQTYGDKLGQARRTFHPVGSETPDIPPPAAFADSLSREDLLSADKLRPVFTLPDDQLPAYLAELEIKAKHEKLWNPYKALEKALKKERNAAKRQQRAAVLPDWAYLDGWGNTKINESDYVELFADKREIVCENGVLFGVDGVIPDPLIKQEIQREIAPYVPSDLAGKTDKLLKALKNQQFGTLPPPQMDRIHLANGTLLLDGRQLNPHKELCRNRLPVQFRAGADCPVWENFTKNLLEPEDILTLQEYMGYLLLPTTRAQKALYICGNGGEGKSRVAAVCKMLLGENCFMGKLHTIEERFGVANLETYLAFIDDDITDAAFKSTDMLKQVITAATAIPIEKKGVQTYQGIVFARILCCGNNFATALFDRSDGFFRRQLLLRTRPGAKVENPDRALDDKLRAELPGILNWALNGLDRLVKQGWEFTESERAKQTLEEVKQDACNVIGFMESDFVVWGDELCVFSKDILPAYDRWCRENAENPVPQNTLIRYIREHYSKKVKYSTNVRENPTGIRRRGFFGFTCRPDKYAPACRFSQQTDLHV